MKVLVIGGGGREHALVWAIGRSAEVTEVVCAPGNGGISGIARCIPVDVNDLHAMVNVVAIENPALTVVGPEVPLSLGLVDALQKRKMRVFGPTQAAARLESSKAFAKEFMQRNEIPTAVHAVCTTLDEVREQLRRFSVPVVVKADGLAAGKGVVICETHLQAEAAATQMFSGTLLGVEETEVVLEEFLDGEELSFFALCDGRHAVAIAAAQDHKRVGEGDTGPNTGGMRQWLTKNIAQRVVDGMRSEGNEFKGILFCGIMMTARGPMVLEFNTRFGDPETQAIMLRMETDVLDLFNASIDGNANLLSVKMRPGASACVIAASGGYPGKYASGKPIHGISEPPPEDVVVFHSGTAIKDGQLVTAGGRVLSITAVAPDLRTALDKAYAEIAKISFEGMQYRRDIGHRALRQELV
jgi:phosphoribosylamine--glycine ligase